MHRFPKSIAFVAGLVSATGFAPLGLWPLLLLALALMLHLVRAAPDGKAAFARGYHFAAGHFILGLNWIAGSFAYQAAMPVWLGWVAVVALSLYLAVFPALAGALSWRAAKGASDTLFLALMASAWILTEWLRATMFTGFAWNPLGVAFVGVGDASRWVGTYGLSGLALLLAGALWLGVRRQLRGAAFALALPFVLTGVAMLTAPAFRQDGPRPMLRVVQPNIGQQDKHDPSFDAVNFRKLEEQTGAPAATPRLILWPEAAVPDYLEEDEGARQRLASLIGPKDVLLTGGVALEYNATGALAGARNSVFALTPKGQLIGRYDKAHLVPYGEYLPMRPVLSAMGLSRLVPGDIDFWSGPGAATLALPGFGKVGLQICYEMIFSGQVVDARQRPDFLFNPSNDAWFGAWGPPQHLAQARLRAMEEGLPVVRSTPTGISAVISADGTLLAALPYQQAGALSAPLPPARTPTLFARFGNILPLGFALILGLLAIATRRALR